MAFNKKPFLISGSGHSFELTDTNIFGGEGCPIQVAKTEKNIKLGELKQQGGNYVFKPNVNQNIIWFKNGMILDKECELIHNDQFTIGDSTFSCRFINNFWQKPPFWILAVTILIMLVSLSYQQGVIVKMEDGLLKVKGALKNQDTAGAAIQMNDVKRLEQKMLVAPALSTLEKVIVLNRQICEGATDSLKCWVEFYQYALSKVEDNQKRLLITNELYKYRFLNEVLSPTLQLLKQKNRAAALKKMHSVTDITDNFNEFKIYTTLIEPFCSKKSKSEIATELLKIDMDMIKPHALFENFLEDWVQDGKPY